MSYIASIRAAHFLANSASTNTSGSRDSESRSGRTGDSNRFGKAVRMEEHGTIQQQPPMSVWQQAVQFAASQPSSLLYTAAPIPEKEPMSSPPALSPDAPPDAAAPPAAAAPIPEKEPMSSPPALSPDAPPDAAAPPAAAAPIPEKEPMSSPPALSPDAPPDAAAPPAAAAPIPEKEPMSSPPALSPDDDAAAAAPPATTTGAADMACSIGVDAAAVALDAEEDFDYDFVPDSELPIVREGFSYSSDGDIGSPADCVCNSIDNNTDRKARCTPITATSATTATTTTAAAASSVRASGCDSCGGNGSAKNVAAKTEPGMLQSSEAAVSSNVSTAAPKSKTGLLSSILTGKWWGSK
jgi:hypothetical protein